MLTGTIDKCGINCLLHNAEMVVCPTLFEGGGSAPVMEAVLADIPVACSNIPQILEQFSL